MQNCSTPPPPRLDDATKEGLVLGSKEALYPILSWVLTNQTELAKRAYLARMLTLPCEVPASMLADPEIADVHEEVGNEHFSESGLHNVLDVFVQVKVGAVVCELVCVKHQKKVFLKRRETKVLVHSSMLVILFTLVKHTLSTNKTKSASSPCTRS